MSKLNKLLANANPVKSIPPLKLVAIEAVDKWVFENEKVEQFALTLKLKDGSSILGLVALKFEDFQSGGWTVGKVLFKGVLPTSEMHQVFEVGTGIEKDDYIEKREKDSAE